MQGSFVRSFPLLPPARAQGQRPFHTVIQRQNEETQAVHLLGSEPILQPPIPGPRVPRYHPIRSDYNRQGHIGQLPKTRQHSNTNCPASLRCLCVPCVLCGSHYQRLAHHPAHPAWANDNLSKSHYQVRRPTLSPGSSPVIPFSGGGCGRGSGCTCHAWAPPCGDSRSPSDLASLSCLV